ncbi:LysR family transcriptional regulator [Rhodovibrio sodomensis]|uniref:LysR family transcriptional regulator n=1 Tax=Rhodovibrio sodomensis TaxID=1088 RepID=A0ABS1DCR0_9PROT|nr:LysR family transcriptional regulator [Rhodovibrio sodomensis]MBK1667190.1 LysR family transcriptional regulator [Rhodovibrio sodomensis]
MTASARLRVLLGEATAIGPGKADLLDAVARTGSISGAARSMGMSYRRAWLLIDTMNKCFRAPLVETNAGGKGGGGAQVTDLGHDVLARYRAMEHKARTAVGADLDAFQALLADDSLDDTR